MKTSGKGKQAWKDEIATFIQKVLSSDFDLWEELSAGMTQVVEAMEVAKEIENVAESVKVVDVMQAVGVMKVMEVVELDFEAK